MERACSLHLLGGFPEVLFVGSCREPIVTPRTPFAAGSEVAINPTGGSLGPPRSRRAALPEGAGRHRDGGDGGEAARRVRGRCCGGRARAAAVEPSPAFTKHVSVPVRSVTGHQVEALADRFAASHNCACGYLVGILTIKPPSGAV